MDRNYCKKFEGLRADNRGRAEGLEEKEANGREDEQTQSIGIEGEKWELRDYKYRLERTQQWVNEQCNCDDVKTSNKRKIRKSSEWRNVKSKIYLHHREHQELYQNIY